MSEMIERVFKAILECPNSSDYRTLVAKRSIEAMREPTLRMIAAAWHKESITDIWQAMIDEALK